MFCQDGKEIFFVFCEKKVNLTGRSRVRVRM